MTPHSIYANFRKNILDNCHPLYMSNLLYTKFDMYFPDVYFEGHLIQYNLFLITQMRIKWLISYETLKIKITQNYDVSR